MADDVTQAVIFSLTVTRGKSKGRMRQDVLLDSQTFLIYMAAWRLGLTRWKYEYDT